MVDLLQQVEEVEQLLPEVLELDLQEVLVEQELHQVLMEPQLEEVVVEVEMEHLLVVQLVLVVVVDLVAIENHLALLVLFLQVH